MSIWNDYSIERKVRDILDVAPRRGADHFGRPFLTAYQIAILFAERYREDMDAIGKEIGGLGTGLSHSLAQYLARELSQRLRTGRLPGIEGRFLHGTRLKALKYRSPDGDIMSSTGTASDLSMFRLADD
ncbi:MAG: hypothetical protein OXF98_07490 [Rhodospirillaceae bacterium]|nr:hypothetical protein [Rhodospirillaceae bacterium]